MDRDTFFELVDEVLAEAGRDPLPGGGVEQRIIEVRPEDRVLQILAGPGSGKTEMLIWRVLYEAFVRESPTSRMVVTTFTEKAAKELNVRVVDRSDALLVVARDRGLDLADPRVHDLRIGTVHSLCDRLLQEFDHQHLESGTVLIDEVETAVRLARDHRWALGREGGRRVVDRLLANDALRAVFRAPWAGESQYDRTVEVVEFLQELLAQHTETWIPRCTSTQTPNGIQVVHGPEELTEDLVKLQRRWEEYLDDRGVLDFATIQKRFLSRQDLLLCAFDHVFVDEFQDTNPVQFAIHTSWLDAPGTRLTVVGDDDQSLYRFRGSDFECFRDLEPHCRGAGVGFRLERLERNWRSTRQIVDFANDFREGSVLATISLEKRLQHGEQRDGPPVRLVSGPWTAICEYVADDIAASGAGRIPEPSGDVPPEAAILLFSTSERGRSLHLREALERRAVRVYNPRAKTAGQRGSPVYELFGLISYLIDPVTMAPVGNSGRSLEVWATRYDRPAALGASPTEPPTFRIADAHAAVQKGFRKTYGTIAQHGSEIAPLLVYVDELRERLVAEGRPRLTLAGLVSRLLTFEHFRDVGFTRDLFREVLFTELLESHVAPTRLSRSSLDQPMNPRRNDNGKVEWEGPFWGFLNVFGQLLNDMRLDDPDVEQFAEHAVAMLTFHQAKGLEFDHVYVGLSGRTPWPHAVLRTKLFSGETTDYVVSNGQPDTANTEIHELATADREREVYVALSRAESSLTFIVDPDDDYDMARLNPVVHQLFDGIPAITTETGLTIREYGT